MLGKDLQKDAYCFLRLLTRKLAGIIMLQIPDGVIKWLPGLVKGRE